MRVLSVSVGLPRTISYRDKDIFTGIFKDPVAGPVRVRQTNLEGDGQGDLNAHGGRDKAVYLYPSEHYPYWREFLGAEELPSGAMGENLTTEGLLEEEAFIGDVLRIGTAIFRVTQPRAPCYKLAARHDRSDIVERFIEAGLSGFYLSVLEEGEVGAGDKISFIERAQDSISISALAHTLRGDQLPPELAQRALDSEVLPEWWKKVVQRSS